MNQDFWMVVVPKLSAKGDSVFLSPCETYPAREVLKGARVRGQKLCALDKNTLGAFTNDKVTRQRIAQIFQQYFAEPNWIVRLCNVQDRTELNALLNEAVGELNKEIGSLVTPEKKESYNLVRKPVDLVAEHLVAMAEEMTPHRTRVVPLLYLPLDSWLLGNQNLFHPKHLQKAGVPSDCPSYPKVKEQEDYYYLQEVAEENAVKARNYLGKVFPVIYFDLLWGGRYKQSGCNLFQTNPP